MPRTITWLHLSDLHACQPSSAWDATRVIESLKTDLQRMHADNDLKPDLIFFTGDAAFGQVNNDDAKSIAVQFREANDFLDHVRQAFGSEVPKRNLFLVPGNHDVNRNHITRMDRKWLSSVTSLNEVEEIIRDCGVDWRRLLDRLSDYESFLETYGYDHLLTGRDRLLYADMREVAGLRIGIAGFNSAWSSAGAGPDECGSLWIAGRFQLETLRAKLPPNDIAIALIHHPGNWLVPAENPDFFRDLERDFPFVLHGHEHRQFVRQDASNGHTVISAGACHEWSQSKNNGYSFVRLNLDSGDGEVWLREYESDGGGWRPRIVTGKTDDRGRWSLHNSQLWQKATTSSPTENGDASSSKPAPTPVTTATLTTDYESRYRKAVVDRLDYVQLFGIEVPRETREYSLTVAYVSLNLADELAEDDDGAEDDETDNLESDAPTEGRETSLPAEEFFTKLRGDTRRLLIRGVAGCGKTTLLRWAAVQAGKGPTPPTNQPAATTPSDEAEDYEELIQDIPTNECDWRHLVPFVVRLRDFPNGELPRPQDYALRLAKELPDAPDGWMDEVLDSGRALIMFDGADEVPPARRQHVIGEIRQLMNTWPKNAYVITTRPEAVEQEEFTELGFISARVEAMSAADRDTFVERWHDAMEVRLQKQNAARDLRPLSNRLKERLSENPAISRLTGIPLLCAAVCALHLQRSENLPETPVDLCDKLAEMLLERRDKERPTTSNERSDDEQYAELNYANRKGLLSRLAHYMVLHGLSAIDEADVDREIAEGLKSNHLTNLRPERIRQALVERSGMLVESSEQRIEFLHNTLKEFLAAERFVNRGDYQIMADHCHEEGWQPVILFALALPREGSEFATNLIKAILEKTPLDGRSTGKGRTNAQMRRVAAVRPRQFFFLRCYTTAYQINDANVDTAFEKLSSSLLPPANLTDAEALATCGDSVVPFLARNFTQYAKQRAACVRTLGLIGSATACRMIAAYGGDTTSTVQSEFKRILLNSPKVFNLIGHKLTGLKTLNLTRSKITDLTPLNTLPALQMLYLARSSVSNISPLASHKKLAHLTLHATSVSDLSAIGELRQMQALHMDYTKINNLSPLAPLTNLQHLSASGTSVGDLSPLMSLKKLRSLTVRNTPVSDLTPLRMLTALTSLDVSQSAVTDASPLESLAALKSLNLGDTLVNDLSPLAKLINLKSLDLNNTPVTNISDLGQMTSLKSLDVGQTQVSDLSVIANLVELTELKIRKTKSTDFAWLPGLTKLRSLNVSGTTFGDLSQTTSLTDLQVLNLHGTQVCDVSRITPLEALRLLDLRGTQVCDLSPLVSLTNLRVLYLTEPSNLDLSTLTSLTEGQLTIYS